MTEIFEARKGGWRFRGKPVVLTTAWRWPQEDYSAEENIEHLRIAARDGFTSADLWFRGRDLWDGSGWTSFDGADRYVEEAARLGLVVVVTIDYSASRMPEELIRKHGWKVVTEEGEELPLVVNPDVPDSYVFQNLPLCDPSFAHATREFVQAVVQHYRGNEWIGYWNIMGEVWGFKPYLKPGTGALETGYDEFIRDKFREWLRGRYDLKGLSQKWGRRAYGSWEDVEPPVGMRRADFGGEELGRWEAAWWDWHSFKLEATVGFMRKVGGWIRELDRRPQMVEYNAGMTGYYNQWDRENRWDLVIGEGLTNLGVQAFERNYKNQIYYNCIARGNSPPPHQLNEINLPNMAMALESEGQAEVDPVAFGRRLLWLCQAMGATGMNVNWLGDLVQLLRGEPKEDHSEERRRGYQDVKRTNLQFHKLGEEFAASSPPPPKIAVLVVDETTLRESGLAVGLAKPILRVLVEQGYGSEVAIVSERQVLEGHLGGYRLVFLPRAPYLRREIAERLEAYVEDGGFLVVGPGSGRYDEHGESYGGLCEPLRRCCGVNPKQMLHPDCDTHDFSVAKEFHRLRMGRLVRGDYLEELEIESENTVVPLRFNWQAEQPAMVLNSYGKGRCCYLGFWPSDDREEKGLEDVVISLVEDAGLEPYVRVSGERGLVDKGVIAGVRFHPGGTFLILIETADREHRLQVELNAERFELERAYVEERPAGGKEVSLGGGGGWKFPALLGPAEVKVFHLRSSGR